MHYENYPSDEIERRVREMDLYSTTSAPALCAKRDPILTTLFAAALGPGGLGLFAAGSGLSTAASIASAITITGMTPGLMRFP